MHILMLPSLVYDMLAIWGADLGHLGAFLHAVSVVGSQKVLAEGLHVTLFSEE